MAVGFDLGDTLCEYAGIPLNWDREYPAALAAVAESCRCELTPEMSRSGIELLLQYNTRVTPRAEEREFTAEHIFAELVSKWAFRGVLGQRNCSFLWTLQADTSSIPRDGWRAEQAARSGCTNRHPDGRAIRDAT